MDFRSVLQTNSKRTIKALTLKKSSLHLFITLTLILSLFLSALGNTDVRNGDDITVQQTDLPDMDKDGLPDALEMTLGTLVDDKFGDKDMDGLYDFEEYLDHYGTPDISTDTPKYNY